MNFIAGYCNSSMLFAQYVNNTAAYPNQDKIYLIHLVISYYEPLFVLLQWFLVPFLVFSEAA